jgi:hypothetical protein
MTDTLWTKPGGSLSHKNVCKEYDLTEQDLFTAMRAGTLQFREGSAHGNPYFKLLRVEVEALVLELHGAAAVAEQAFKHQLQQIDKEINSYKRKLTALNKQRIELVEAHNRRVATGENESNAQP